jgi:hypothetical protein
MGRTVMPFSYLLEKEHGRWKELRKCLSKENQEAFHPLFDRAKFHTAAGVYMPHPVPLETILLHMPGTRKNDRRNPEDAKRKRRGA